MKKRLILSCAITAAAVCGILAVLPSQPSPVTELTIFPDSMSLVTGVSAQLIAEAHTENGGTATAEQYEALELVWEYKAENGAFTVSEDGFVTPISPGTGNVWVTSGDGKLSSRPITVFVKE